jgi:hypothetical protein
MNCKPVIVMQWLLMVRGEREDEYEEALYEGRRCRLACNEKMRERESEIERERERERRRERERYRRRERERKRERERERERESTKAEPFCCPHLNCASESA